MPYEFQTHIGMFRIEPDADDPDAVLLSIDNVPIGKYPSAPAAAEAVYAQETGWEHWDLLQEITGPRDLTEWKED